jgi:hypothetical protein
MGEFGQIMGYTTGQNVGNPNNYNPSNRNTNIVTPQEKQSHAEKCQAAKNSMDKCVEVGGCSMYYKTYGKNGAESSQRCMSTKEPNISICANGKNERCNGASGKTCVTWSTNSEVYLGPDTIDPGGTQRFQCFPGSGSTTITTQAAEALMNASGGDGGADLADVTSAAAEVFY